MAQAEKTDAVMERKRRKGNEGAVVSLLEEPALVVAKNLATSLGELQNCC
jgi:hypothetical protein